MNYLGIDWGEKRIGLAFADEIGIAMPLQAAVAASKKERMRHIAEMITQRRAQELVVGYPLNMDGSIGFKAKEVDVFIEEPPTDTEFLSLPNLMVSPHIGGNAKEAVEAMGQSAIGHLVEFFRDHPPKS